MMPWEFWELTPYEFGLVSEGYIQRQRQGLQDKIYLAWHIEALARQKKLPKLDTLLKSVVKKRSTSQKKLNKQQLIDIAKKKGLSGPW